MAFGQADNYIGTHADDAAATAALAGSGWAAKIGMWYLTTVGLNKRWWDGAAWRAVGEGAFPGIELEQVLFVDEGSNTSEDGSASAPYQTIAAAYTQAKTLSPTVTNPVTLFIWGGVYDESLTLDTDYINLVGIGRDSVLIRRTGGTAPTITVEDITAEISNLSVMTTVNGQPALLMSQSGGSIQAKNVYFEAGGNGAAAAAVRLTTAVEFRATDCEMMVTTGFGIILSCTAAAVIRLVNVRYWTDSSSDGNMLFTSGSLVILENCISTNISRSRFAYIAITGGTGSFYFRECLFDAAANSGQQALDIDAAIELNVLNCTFDDSSMRWTEGDIEAHVVGCKWGAHLNSYDIQQTQNMSTPAEIEACEMHKGMNYLVDIINRIKRVCGRALGWGVFYNTFEDAVRAVWEDDAVVQLNVDYPLQSDGAITPDAIRLVIDGQGQFGWTKNAGTDAFTLTNATDITFHRCIGMQGDINMNDDNDEMAVRLVECEMVGCIKVTACAANSIVSVEGSQIIGESNSQYCIDINDPSPTVYVLRSYLKGDTGDPAIDNPSDNANLKIGWSTVIHGDVDESYPIVSAGAIAYSSHHNMYNADPGSGNLTNNIATPYDSFDVDGDWGWGLP